MVVITETYIIGAFAILLNSMMTGFAVYLGSHAGKRVIDNISEKQHEKDNKERAEFQRLYKKYSDQVEIPKVVGDINV